jgi:hypothetical protein
MQQSFPTLTGFNIPETQTLKISSPVSPVASTRAPVPNAHYSQVASGFGRFDDLHMPPPSADVTISFPEIIESYSGMVSTIGKTIPISSTSSIKTTTCP